MKMMNVRNGLMGLTIIGLLVGGIYFNSNQTTPTSTPKKEVGAQNSFSASNLSLDTLDGKKTSLYPTNGKPTLLVFWASWCKHCKKEMPNFQKAYERYKDKMNFVAVDKTFQDKEKDVKAYMKENNFTFPVLLDKAGIAFKDYNVKGVPTNFIISSKKTVTLKKVGVMTAKDLDKEIIKVLQHN